MSTIRQMRDYINQVPTESLFTTRVLLNYGKRTRVDDAVYELVKSGELVRVARGVFHRPERTTPVSIIEIAKVKAISFGREIIEHASEVAKRYGLIEDSLAAEAEHWFSIGGRSSSFRFGSTTIHFKGTSLRNMKLGDSPCGKVIRALRFVGKGLVSAELVGAATSGLNQSQKEELGRSCALMPAWLSDFFCCWYCNPKDTANPAISSLVIYSPAGKKDPALELGGSDGLTVSESCTNLRAFVQRAPIAHYSAKTRSTLRAALRGL